MNQATLEGTPLAYASVLSPERGQSGIEPTLSSSCRWPMWPWSVRERVDEAEDPPKRASAVTGLMCLLLDVRGEGWDDAVVLHRGEDFRGR